MTHEKETWSWEIKLLAHYVAIIAVGCVLAGLIAGKGFWQSEIANMKEQLPLMILCLAWLVTIPVGGILLRRYVFCWSPQAKLFVSEKEEHEERMRKYREA